MTLEVKASFAVRDERIGVHAVWPVPNERSYQDALKIISYYCKQKDNKIEVNL